MPEPKYQPPEEQEKQQNFMMDFIQNNRKAVIAGVLAVVVVVFVIVLVIVVPGGPVTSVQKDLEMFPTSSTSSLIIKLNGDNSEIVNDVEEKLKIYNDQAAGQYIDFHPDKLGPCETSPFGFGSTRPCLFFQLPLRMDWKPEQITEEDFDTHKEELKDFREFWNNQIDKNQYWVDCTGVSEDDKEALGNFKYYPAEQGIQKKYYPYKGGGKYHSPLVAVQLDLNQRNVGETIEMKCNVYFKDVTPDAGTLILSLKIEN